MNILSRHQIFSCSFILNACAIDHWDQNAVTHLPSCQLLGGFSHFTRKNNAAVNSLAVNCKISVNLYRSTLISLIKKPRVELAGRKDLNFLRFCIVHFWLALASVLLMLRSWSPARRVTLSWKRSDCCCPLPYPPSEASRLGAALEGWPDQGPFSPSPGAKPGLLCVKLLKLG